jgi:anaerobic magnesium-protoporphyrin IX monomethyl ester cyclase
MVTSWPWQFEWPIGGERNTPANQGQCWRETRIWQVPSRLRYPATSAPEPNGVEARRLGSHDETAAAMKVALLFPPVTSLTYVPLGLASLAAHARARGPGAAIVAWDLNRESWDWLAARDPGVGALRAFLRGEGCRVGTATGAAGAGTFFDAQAYEARRPAWNLSWARMNQLADDARRYIETGELGDDAGLLLDRFVERVLAEDPALVGISVMYLDQLAFALALARRLRESSAVPRGAFHIVLGGASMSALQPEEILAACPYVDAIAFGEGESAIAALCAGTSLGRVAGMMYRDGASIRANPPAGEAAIDSLAPPDFSDLTLAGYWNPEPVLPALFSRGCAWRRCRFCAHNASFGHHRRKEIGAFVTELERNREQLRVRHIYLADQYIRGADLAAIADALITEGLDLRLHTMGRPDEEYSSARLVRLQRAGFRWVSWGVESGSQRLLEVVCKGTRVPVIERVVRETHDAGIANMLMMIFGLPTGTDEDLAQTFDMIERCSDAIDIMTTSQFVLFAGTPFAGSAAELGLEILGPRELLRAGGRVIHSTRLDFREIARDGSLRPSRGPLEIAAWERRKRWLKDFTREERLSTEHTLLYFSRR